MLKRKVLCQILIGLLTLTFCMNSFALEIAPPTENDVPYYTEQIIFDPTAELSLSGSLMNPGLVILNSPSANTIYISFSISASTSVPDTLERLGYLSMTLYELNGSTWKPKTSWGIHYDTNTRDYYWSTTLTSGISGAQYYLTGKAYAKQGDEIQESSFQTGTIICK